MKSLIRSIFNKGRSAMHTLRQLLVMPHNLSFPQPRIQYGGVGNPSEYEERFRTSRNDKRSADAAAPLIITITSYLTFLIAAPLPLSAEAAETGDKVIKGITVEGLYSIQKEELLYLLDLKAGDKIDRVRLERGIRRAFLKGIFEDIEVYEEEPGGAAASGTPMEGEKTAPLRVKVVERDFIKRVIISGNSRLSARVIREHFPLKEGQLMRYDLLDESVKKLRQDLSQRGFEHADAIVDVEKKDEPYRVNVLVKVSEGEPTLIGKIRVIGPEEVRSKVKISEGDVFDQYKLREDLERLRKFYKKEEHINFSAGPYTFSGGELDLNVDPGRKLNISFEGNSALSSKALLKEMPFFDAEDYREELVEEASARLTALYHEKGYPDVQLAPVATADKGTVTLHYYVFEGEKTTVGSVTFSGVTLPEKNLKEIMALKEGGVFNPDLLFFDRETLREFYNALGYLNADVQEPDVHINDHKADLTLAIKEGEQTVVTGVGVTGSGRIPEEEIRRAIRIKIGDPYNEVEMLDARYRIIDLYLDHGYVDVIVEAGRELSGLGARITFDIKEGEPSVYGKTIVAGNQNTKRIVVQRDLLHGEGKAMKYGLLSVDRQKLFKLGLFTDVNVESLDKYDSHRDVLVSVKEGNAGAVEFGVGYGDYERYRGFVDVGYRNFFGMNRQGSARFEYSSLEKRFILNYHEPWLFDMHIPFRAVLLAENRSERNIDTGEIQYRLKRVTLTAGIEKKISDAFKEELYYDFSVVKTYDVQPDVILTKEDTGTLAISAIRPGVIYDTRDNPFEPRHGILAGVTLKFASKYFLSETDFVKMAFNGNYYRQLANWLVLAVSLRGGVAYALSGSKELPLVERFFLGGRSTARGYDQDTLGPKGSNGTPTGGNAFLLTNLELRTFLGKGIGLVAFVDGGNVWLTASEMDLKFKYTAGLGVRYGTPVGPLRVDYGFKLNREPGESRGEIHFSVGHAF